MTKTCPNCHQPNLPEAAFCHNCASPLSATQRTPFTPQPVQQSGQQNPVGASQKAVIALVLAIAALVCCGPFAGIPAAIVGWMELSAIGRGESSPAGKWMAQAGLWGGIAFTVIHVVIYFFYLVFAMLAASNPYQY